MPKLVFKTEKDLLDAFLGCKFAQIPCETEYEEDEKADYDILSLDIKGEI
jgi:hypothetical protein